MIAPPGTRKKEAGAGPASEDFGFLTVSALL
jgi:hypothetical protein